MRHSLTLYAAFCTLIATSAMMVLPGLRSAEADSVQPQQLESPAYVDPSVHRLADRLKAETTMVDARAPVPLLVAPKPPVAPPVAETAKDKTVAAAGDIAVLRGPPESATKAIEADGYKRVRVLERRADGKWRALAMRGNVEIALSVDDSGNVSSE